ncbi:pyridoxal-phosphate dependent enzyme [Thermaerobacter subterraneus]|uniref:threonine ammonia-lyase n=1 Tax=Thermaerobacter subterraneus DSM 13965 TaxID=867903 RepID=K6NZ48_9FIRM|nr:pyridoxal-phosphate dependent enzyme [Thermaerobacter subterraneus]EKP94140.1 threonine dehydratase [Thermaerobacter subterraneus DSM 13965]
MPDDGFWSAGCWSAELAAARGRVARIAARTPLIPSPALSERLGTGVYLKLETLQPTGSFKLRGAANKLVRLAESAPSLGSPPGVVTFSTGNHGRAVAYVARRLGLRAVVCVSEGVPPVKLEAIRRLGAELAMAPTQDDAEALCARLATEQGLVVVHPFDDPDIIAGQGTLGLEILDDLPEVEAVIVPLSGGGLLSGVGLALRHFGPPRPVQLIGVSMERGRVMFHSLRAGHPVTLPEEPSLADSLVGGIGLDNRWTFRLVGRLATDAVLVSEEAIARAMTFMLEEHGLLVEGGAATAIAALLEAAPPTGTGRPDAAAGRNPLTSLRGVFPWRPGGPLPVPRRIVVVVTGRNVDPRRVLGG